MSKVYRFIYDSEFQEDEPTEYPEASTVKVRHYFADFTAWPKVLYEFCKFLETSGYSGVLERVVIKDPYNMESDGLFETIGPGQYIATAKTNDSEEEDGIIGTAKVGTPEWKEAMKDLEGYFDSLSEEEKQDLKGQGYKV
jgi:hypothetical protein